MILTLVLHSLAVLLALLVITLMYFLLTQAVAIYSAGQKKTITGSPETPSSEKGREVPHRAIIHCRSYPPAVPIRFKAEGYTTCHALHRVYNGNSACSKGCLGIGSCADICPSGAILMSRGSLSITDACTGCGLCRTVCPKNLIEIIPVCEAQLLPCAGAAIEGIAEICPEGQKGHRIDHRIFPDSCFKKLLSWDILAKKSR